MVAREFLQNHALFGGISDSQMDRIVPLLKESGFAAGVFVVRQGERGDRLYFICSGSVEVVEEVPGPAGPEARVLAVLGAGESFGEMALIDIQPRSASVRAREAVQLLSLSNLDMHVLYKQDVAAFVMLVMNIAREISRRLRRVNSLLASSVYCAGQEDSRLAT